MAQELLDLIFPAEVWSLDQSLSASGGGMETDSC